MAYGIDKRSSTYGNHNVWRSDVFVAGDKFTIDEIRIYNRTKRGGRSLFYW